MGMSSSSSNSGGTCCCPACSCASLFDCPVLSSVSSGFSVRTARRTRMLVMHLVHIEVSFFSPSPSVPSTPASVVTPIPRVVVKDWSNCAEMRATRTWAVIEGTILAVARSSSCAIWSRLLVPFLPRMAMISSIFLATFSSESTICSLGLASCATFSFSSLTLGALTSFFFTFSNPSSSSESSALADFIHLLMPVAPDCSSSLEEESVEPPQSLSSSSSSSSSSSLSLPFAFFLASFFSSSLSLSDSSSLSLSSLSSSLSSFSSSLSAAPFSAKAAMASS
mmetsp:Transcript_37326/g.95338  ORF Transcript_37326/g.95338 Transcript_37326/m.95338 type:complete len:280 (-) Transcript_37326:514-1353(-)